jgi:thiamine biosynthesis lipoprotein
LPLTGADKITLSTTPYYSVSLAPGTKITLGGLAKGYIVDQGLAVLRAAGIQHALINAGGDIGVFGGKPEGKWEIVLSDPNNPDNHLAHFLLGDGALATSGNYERYFDKEAEVGHIIDPRTGYSSHGSSSATVISPTCVQADCLATATFILGPTEGITLIDSLPDVEALIVDYEEPSQIYTSSGLSIYEDKK